MGRSNGFTLIELIIVIVILGIVAVTAAPKFLSFSNDANQAVVESYAGGLSTGVTLFRSKWQLGAKQSSVNGYTVVANEQGTPTGVADDDIAHESDCQNIWQDLLADPPSLAFITGLDGWSAAFSGDEWGSSASELSGETDDIYCHFVLASAATDDGVPMVIYNIQSGEVTTGEWPYTP